MNHERMLKVADVIEASPDHFDIDTFATVPAFVGKVDFSPVGSMSAINGWVGPKGSAALLSADLYACGTTACIAGWACWLWGAEVDIGVDIDENAAKILDISLDDTDDLFERWELDTADKAVAHLRNLVREDLAR